MTITVLIPTYRRPDDLRRCLTALTKQERPADEVRIVLRDTDTETPVVLKEFSDGLLPIVISTVHESGQIAALNVGCRDATGEIVAITDDDGAPWPDWIARIEKVFKTDPRIAGVGGRDWVYDGNGLEPGAEQSVVGIVCWYGKVIGAHHLGVGGPREVDVLKGVNSAYRTKLLQEVGFDRRLLGSGAQVHNELSLGMHITHRLGLVLHYDPAIAVDHGRGKRHDEDQRDAFNALAVRNMVYNETIILLDHFSLPQRLAFGIWAIAVGTGVAPGLVQLPRLIARGDRHALARWVASMKGRTLAVRHYYGSGRPNASGQAAVAASAT